MKNIKIKKSFSEKNNKHNFQSSYRKKIIFYKKIIQKTILSVQKYKTLDILGASELNVCIKNLENIFLSVDNVAQELEKKKSNELLIEKLQEINNELAIVFRTFGTADFKYLIAVVFGKDFLETISHIEKLNNINNYIHQIGYK